jgi:hypothetical protein
MYNRFFIIFLAATATVVVISLQGLPVAAAPPRRLCLLQAFVPFLV